MREDLLALIERCAPAYYAKNPIEPGLHIDLGFVKDLHPKRQDVSKLPRSPPAPHPNLLSVARLDP